MAISNTSSKLTVSDGDKGDISVTGSGTIFTVDNLAITNAKIANTTIDLTTKVTGILPVANGGTGVAAPTGTYTPTLTAVANVAASTAHASQWMRVADMVTVSGKLDIDPTLTATLTQIRISLPVASNFATNEELGGVAFANAVAGMGGAIRASGSFDAAQLEFVSTDVTNQAMSYLFMYRII